MIRNIFRFFVFICFVSVSICVQSKGDSIWGRRTYTKDIRVCFAATKQSAAGQHPIKGLIVTLTSHKWKGNGTYPQATTGDDGCVVFKDGCRGIESEEKWFKIEDPERIFATVHRGFAKEDKDNCYGAFVLPRLDQDEMVFYYLDPETVKNYAVDMNGELQFYDVCHTKDNIPPKVQAICVDEPFIETEVQVSQGAELAQLYYENLAAVLGIEMGSQFLKCNTGAITVEHNYDYLQCTSLDAKFALEFKFRDLRESDFKKIQKNTATSLCSIFGMDSHAGDSDPQFNVYAACHKAGDDVDKVRQKCAFIDTIARKTFGWSAPFINKKGIEDSIRPNEQGQQSLEPPYSAISEEMQEKLFKDTQGRLDATALNRRVDISSSRTVLPCCEFKFARLYYESDINRYPGLDSRKFEKLEVYSDDQLFNIINAYVDSMIPYYKNLECTKGLSVLPHSTLFGGTDYEHVVKCILTDGEGEQHPVDFVFASVTASNDFHNNAGQAGAKCMARNGIFDGRNCVGIGESQCAALNYLLEGGTAWKDNVCQMRASRQLDTHKTILHHVDVNLQIGFWITMTAITTYESGGAAAFAWITTALAEGAQFADLAIEEWQKGRAQDFIYATAMCPSAVTCDENGESCSSQCSLSSCAKELLLKRYGDIKGLLPKLGSEPSQLQKAVAEAFDLLLAKIGPDCVDEEFTKQYLNAQSEVETARFWVDLVGNAALAASAIRGNVGSIKSLSQGALPTLSRMCSIAKNALSTHTLMQKSSEMIVGEDLPGIELGEEGSEAFGIFKVLAAAKKIKC